MEETTFTRVALDLEKITYALKCAYRNLIAAFFLHWPINTLNPFEGGNPSLNQVWDRVIIRMKEIIAEITDYEILDDWVIEAFYREVLDSSDRWLLHHGLSGSHWMRGVFIATLSDLEAESLRRVTLRGGMLDYRK